MNFLLTRLISPNFYGDFKYRISKMRKLFAHCANCLKHKLLGNICHMGNIRFPIWETFPIREIISRMGNVAQTAYRPPHLYPFLFFDLKRD